MHTTRFPLHPVDDITAFCATPIIKSVKNLFSYSVLNSTSISQAWLKATESFSVSPNHSWLFDVMIMNIVQESLGC